MPKPIAWFLIGEPLERPPAEEEIKYFSDAGAALANVAGCQKLGLVLCDSQIFPHLYQQNITIDLPYDLIHAGLRLLPTDNMESLLFSSLNWHLLDPSLSQESASWKATPQACFLRPSIVRLLGGFDTVYRSPTAQLMDLAHRLLRSGGRLHYCPGWLPPEWEIQDQELIGLMDEFLFIRRRMGGRFTTWYTTFARGIAKRELMKTLQASLSAAKRAKLIPPPLNVRFDGDEARLLGDEKRQLVTSITAVIPTLSRYDYLPQAIDSLLKQSRPPDQIVVVDQTPPAQRQLEIYQKYDGQPVEVIFLEQAGQSLARNTAIKAATGEWCLFFDDDSVAWEGLIAEHVNTVEMSGAEVATGLSLAPWKNKTHIPGSFRHYHLTHVLDTGNSLVKKSALNEVGGFDRAFDKGAGADNDLGTRLHLHGFEIVFNPRSIRTHYKATQGGLRTHGAWWRHQSARKAPFPPPTQVYTIQRYYPRPCWQALYFLYYFRAKRHYSFWGLIGLWLALPWKLSRSLQAVNHLKMKRELKITKVDS